MPTAHEIAVTLTAKDAGLDAGLRRAQGLMRQFGDSTKGLGGAHQASVAGTNAHTAALNNLGQAQQGSATAARGLTSALSSASNVQRSSVAGVTSLTSSLWSLAAQYLAVQTVVRGTTAALGASSALEQQNRAWQGISGTLAGGRKELDFLREAADKLGVRFDSLEGGYRKIAASAKGSSLEGDAARQIFLDIAQAQQVLGASSEDVSGAMRALSQMISTGVVQADELRNELGNSLPGVMNLAAKSMGMTTQEFRKLQETGGVLTETFLPKFARLVKETFVVGGADAANSTRTLGQEAARAMNVLEQLTAIGVKETGLDSFLKRVLSGLTSIGQEAVKAYERLTKIRDVELERAGRIVDQSPGGGNLTPEARAAVTERLARLEEQLLASRQKIVQLHADYMRFTAMGFMERLGSGAPLDVESLRFQAAAEEKRFALLQSQSGQLLSTVPTLTRNPGQPFLGEDYGAALATPSGADQLTPRQQQEAELKATLIQYGATLLAMGKAPLEIAEAQLQMLRKEQEKSLEAQTKNLKPPPADIKAMLDAAAAKYKMDPTLIEALARNESNFNAAALSKGGAMGVMQLMPKTGAALGLSGPEFFDAAKNIDAGVRYFAQMVQQFGGDVRLALSAYNAGPGALEKAGRRPELLPFAENRAFAGKVLGMVQGPSTMPLQAEGQQLEDYIAQMKGLEVANKAGTEATQDNFDAIAKLIDQLTNSSSVLGQNRREHILNELAQRGAGEATLEMAKAYHTEMLALEDSNEAAKESLKVKKTIRDEIERALELEERNSEGIHRITESMREGLPTIAEYEEALRKLQGLNPGDNAVQLAESYRERSTAAFQAINDGAANLASTLQSTLIDSLTGGKDAWKQFGDTAVRELLRIILNATQFEKNMEQILSQVGHAIANMFQGGAAGGTFNNSAYGSSGGAALAAGGPLRAHQTALTGEQGSELLVTRSGMRLVGRQGPEIIRSREAGYVLPHRETMTLMGGITRRAAGGPILANMPILVGDGAPSRPVMRQGQGQGGPITVHLNLHNVRDAQSFVASRRQVQRAVIQSVAQAQRSI